MIRRIVAISVRIFKVLWRMIGQIQKFFSLKPSAFQEESSFKISAHEDKPFGRR